MSALDRLLAQLDDHSGMAWNDTTYDLATARSLPPGERGVYVAELISRAQQGDGVAVETLGYLDAQEAVPMLLAAARGAENWAFAGRRALARLGHGDTVLDLLGADVLTGPSMMWRVAAALAVRDIGGAVAIQILGSALADPDYQVRIIAWQGLMSLLELDRHVRDPEGFARCVTRVELLEVWLGSDFASLRALAIDEARALVRRRLAGAEPAALGAVWAPDRVPEVFDAIRAAFFDPESAYPVDSIRTLTGTPRRWAETMILLRLLDSDPRVAATLVELAAGWTAPVLREAAAMEQLPAHLRDRCVMAAQALGRGKNPTLNEEPARG